MFANNRNLLNSFKQKGKFTLKDAGSQWVSQERCEHHTEEGGDEDGSGDCSCRNSESCVHLLAAPSLRCLEFHVPGREHMIGSAPVRPLACTGQCLEVMMSGPFTVRVTFPCVCTQVLEILEHGVFC